MSPTDVSHELTIDGAAPAAAGGEAFRKRKLGTPVTAAIAIALVVLLACGATIGTVYLVNEANASSRADAHLVASAAVMMLNSAVLTADASDRNLVMQAVGAAALAKETDALLSLSAAHIDAELLAGLTAAHVGLRETIDAVAAERSFDAVTGAPTAGAVADVNPHVPTVSATAQTDGLLEVAAAADAARAIEEAHNASTTEFSDALGLKIAAIDTARIALSTQTPGLAENNIAANASAGQSEKAAVTRTAVDAVASGSARELTAFVKAVIGLKASHAVALEA